MARRSQTLASRRAHYRATGFSRGGKGWLGLSQSLKELREMGEHVLSAAKAALKNGADRVVADAKSRCPVKTGKLRDSIKAEPNRDGSLYWITANASKPTNNPNSTDGRFYYGQMVEFSPKINKPFLYPALEAHRQEIRDNIDAAINQAIQTGH